MAEDPRFLLHFKTLAKFNLKLADGTINSNRHLVFIQDELKIWCRGKLYSDMKELLALKDKVDGLEELISELENKPSGVLSDWNQTDSTKLDYIKNKPTITSGAAGKTWKPSVDSAGNLSWTEDSSSTAPTTLNIKGPKGDTGVTPTITASAGTNIDTVGTPSVTASTSGTTTTFTFNNLKGAKGDPGTNATTTAVATTSANGLMSKEDKTKLDGLLDYTLPAATADELGGVKIWVGTEEQYNAITTKDSNTLYLIPE